MSGPFSRAGLGGLAFLGPLGGRPDRAYRRSRLSRREARLEESVGELQAAGLAGQDIAGLKRFSRRPESPLAAGRAFGLEGGWVGHGRRLILRQAPGVPLFSIDTPLRRGQTGLATPHLFG